MTYKIKWRRRLFWQTRTISGHGYNPEMDRLTLYYPDGTLEELAKWSECSARLGLDWLAATKKKLEQQAGQSIPLSV